MKRTLLFSSVIVLFAQAAPTFESVRLEAFEDSSSLLSGLAARRILWRGFTSAEILKSPRTQLKKTGDATQTVLSGAAEIKLSGQLCLARAGGAGGLAGAEFPEGKAAAHFDSEFGIGVYDTSAFFRYVQKESPALYQKMWRLVQIRRQLGTPMVSIMSEYGEHITGHQEGIRFSGKELEALLNDPRTSALAQESNAITKELKQFVEWYNKKVTDDVPKGGDEDGVAGPVRYDSAESAAITPKFYDDAAELAEILNYGTQKQLELARGLLYEAWLSDRQQIAGYDERSFAVVDEIRRKRDLLVTVGMRLVEFNVRQRGYLLSGNAYTPEQVAVMFPEREKVDEKNCTTLSESRVLDLTAKKYAADPSGSWHVTHATTASDGIDFSPRPKPWPAEKVTHASLESLPKPLETPEGLLSKSLDQWINSN